MLLEQGAPAVHTVVVGSSCDGEGDLGADSSVHVDAIDARSYCDRLPVEGKRMTARLRRVAPSGSHVTADHVECVG